MLQLFMAQETTLSSTDFFLLGTIASGPYIPEFIHVSQDTSIGLINNTKIYTSWLQPIS